MVAGFRLPPGKPEGSGLLLPLAWMADESVFVGTKDASTSYGATGGPWDRLGVASGPVMPRD